MNDADPYPAFEPRGLRKTRPETSLSSRLFPERFLPNQSIGQLLGQCKVSKLFLRSKYLVSIVCEKNCNVTDFRALRKQ